MDKFGTRIRGRRYAAATILILVGAIYCYQGIMSVYASKNKILTIEQAFGKSDLETYYAKDEAAFCAPAYYICGYELNSKWIVSKECYYLVRPENSDCRITVKATEDWIEQFDSLTGKAKTKVEISGDYRKMDKELSLKLSEWRNQNSLQDSIKTDYYIDNYLKYKNVYRLGFGGVSFILAYVMWSAEKREKMLWGGERSKDKLDMIATAVWFIIIIMDMSVLHIL